MKLLIIILCGLLASCGYTRYAPPPEIKVKVQYILRNDDGSGEVWAVRQSRYRNTLRLYYMAEFFGRIPDSIVNGKVLYLRYKDCGGIDSCECIQFKLMNKNK